MSDDEKHEESIKVCCRFRPQNASERQNNGRICVEVPDCGTMVRVPHSDHTFVLDRVFSWEAGQKEVYDYAAKPIVDAVLKGFNGTVFAYGQTASGKTYTMEGPDIENKARQGVIPRMVWSIFEGIYHADEHIEFLVKVSIVEIYNERIRDLLDPTKDNLQIREDAVRGVFIGDVTESYVGSEREVFDSLRAGHVSRSVSVTNMNEHSSRSHLVFMLTMEQKNCHDRSVKVGKLYLVDLAGSEKVGKTGASGDRLDEAKNINRSLSALGNVINALTDRKAAHIPYRDSKLTRMLQQSLGGNSKTSLIVTCSPSAFNEAETISTLRFGQRAKMIKNVAKVNQERSAEELKLLIDKRELALMECRGRIVILEQGLLQHGLTVPERTPLVKGQSMKTPGSAERQPDVSPAELQDQLVEKVSELNDANERIVELDRERDEWVRRLRSSEDDRNRIREELSNSDNVRESVEVDRGAWSEKKESLEREKSSLQQEYDQLQRINARLREETPPLPISPSTSSKDIDRPLKMRVSQLDKNLEQLTVMYHKLVAQNSGLRVDVGENAKKLQRKEHRIAQLEKNLREAKQKYEKLLTQCANLTATMDVISRTSPLSLGAPVAGAAGGGLVASTPGEPRRMMKVVVPLRGGRRGNDLEDGAPLALGAPSSSSLLPTPFPAPVAAPVPASAPADALVPLVRRNSLAGSAVARFAS